MLELLVSFAQEHIVGLTYIKYLWMLGTVIFVVYDIRKEEPKKEESHW